MPALSAVMNVLKMMMTHLPSFAIVESAFTRFVSAELLVSVHCGSAHSALVANRESLSLSLPLPHQITPEAAVRVRVALTGAPVQQEQLGLTNRRLWVYGGTTTDPEHCKGGRPSWPLWGSTAVLVAGY